MAYKPAVKINAKQQREMLPASILEKVAAYKKRYRCRIVYLETHEAGYQLYLDEGASYTLYGEQTDKEASFRMQSQDSLHAGGQAISYCVGQRTPPIAANNWVLEFNLFLGKPFITVHQIKDTIA